MLCGTGSYSFLGNAFYCYPGIWINFLNKPDFYNVVYIKLDRDADTVHGSFYFCLNHLKLKLWTVCCVYFRLVIYREITDFCYKLCTSSVSDHPPIGVLFLELVEPVLLFVSGKWRI